MFRTTTVRWWACSLVFRSIVSETRVTISGTIREWNPYERRGKLLGDDGHLYEIPNTRAFETVLPTSLTDLVGTRARFVPAAVADGGGYNSTSSSSNSHSVSAAVSRLTDRSMIRRKSDEITENTYRRRTPPAVDLLAAFRVDVPPTAEPTLCATFGDGAAHAHDGGPDSPTASPAHEGDGTVEDDRQQATFESRQPSRAEGLGALPWQRKKRRMASGTGGNDSSRVQRIASDIVVDLTSLPAHVVEKQEREQLERPYVTEGIRPATHIKDLRTTAVLQPHELQRMRELARNGTDAPRRGSVTLDRSPSSAQADEEASLVAPADGLNRAKSALTTEARRRHESARGAPAVQPVMAPTLPSRATDGVRRVGTVVAWSALYRSGLIIAGEVAENAPLPIVQSLETDAFLIQNVDAFDTAMPSNLNLVRRVVTFTAATYDNQPHRRFAENIVIEGPLEYTYTKDKKPAELPPVVHIPFFSPKPEPGTSDASSPSSEDSERGASELTTGPHYGVVTRWSGGQGTIETGSGMTFYVRSAADFLQLVDSGAGTVRGAVVTFHVNPKEPRFATDVNVLSLIRHATKPIPVRDDVGGAAPDTVPLEERVAASQRDSDGASAVDRTQGGTGLWCEGFIVSWSSAEEQGVIEAEDGTRCLLKDTAENVQSYSPDVTKHLLKKGRRVRFCRYGEHGTLACHVHVLDSEADEEQLRKAALDGKQRKRTADAESARDASPSSSKRIFTADEAMASPLAAGYWISKAENAGFDVAEVKARHRQLVPPELMNDLEAADGEEGEGSKGEGSKGLTKGMLDPHEILSKDRWFNDKERNIKLPGSDVRIGDLSQFSPVAMMNLAVHVHDPVKLNKLNKKYVSRLTEAQKEEAWRISKELAPIYGKRLREAKEKGEEPSLHFY